ncbi:MAG: signal peptidase I [Lachnospiraceae bacterium]|nr:signal peptidase I [Lachnospiraceae bacterium]
MARRNVYSQLTTEELLRLIARWIVDVVMVLAAAWFLLSMLGTQVVMDGNSMRPSVESGDRLLVNAFPVRLGTLRRFDAIAYRDEESGRVFIKRILALPGETLVIRDGAIYINGSAVDDHGLFSSLTAAGSASEPLTLSDDEFFVVGERTDASLDSRFSDQGNLRSSQILGRIWFRFGPLRRIGPVR